MASKSASEELLVRLNTNGWQVLKTTSQQSRTLKIFYMLGDTISKSGQYDIAVVDLFSGAAFIWAELVCAALKALDKPFILVLHGGGLPDFAIKHPHRVKRLLNGTAAVVTPSQWIAQAFAHWRSNIRCIPNAIQVSAYPFRLRPCPEPRLCWLRAFHAVYQPWLAVEVVARLKADFPAIELTMIGPDKRDGSLERVQELIRQHHLEDAVHIVGGVAKPEVPRWLSQGEIFLNTTNVDNTPVSVIEALACGLCVVSTNVGGIPYLLEDEADALLVPPDDPQAMAYAVRRILTEPGLAERLSRNARAKAEKFDWTNVLNSWEELFIQVSQAV